MAGKGKKGNKNDKPIVDESNVVKKSDAKE
jgi:hypothetical protein